MNILIDIIKISALTLVFFYIVLMWLPAFLTLRKDYKYYKKTYDLLNSKTYVLTLILCTGTIKLKNKL